MFLQQPALNGTTKDNLLGQRPNQADRKKTHGVRHHLPERFHDLGIFGNGEIEPRHEVKYQQTDGSHCSPQVELFGREILTVGIAKIESEVGIFPHPEH